MGSQTPLLFFFPSLFSYSSLQDHFNLKIPFMHRVWQLEASVAKGVTNVITNFDIIDAVG